MKIEMGESLVYSYLKHIEQCQIVQTNWKISQGQELYNLAEAEQLYESSKLYFKEKYDIDLYKQLSGLSQVLKQSEIDVVGVKLKKQETTVYAVDIAFHTNGLQYGDKNATRDRVSKKLLRMLLSLQASFEKIDVLRVIFASPKVHNASSSLLVDAIDDINKFLTDNQSKQRVELLMNQDFVDTILAPIIQLNEEIVDATELFVRAVQLDRLCKKIKPERIHRPKPAMPTDEEGEDIGDVVDISKEKIGIIAKVYFRRLLRTAEIDTQELENLQDLGYAKRRFNATT
ncbi:MAG: hypothetical protein FWD76_05650 [Firmicutes bacterium]|nr:hypothetical protein [Bacillota bacterium]